MGFADQLLGGHALDFSDANLSQKKHLHRAGSSDGSPSAKIGGAGALGIQLQSMTASQNRDATLRYLRPSSCRRSSEALREYARTWHTDASMPNS